MQTVNGPPRRHYSWAARSFESHHRTSDSDDDASLMRETHGLDDAAAVTRDAFNVVSVRLVVE